MRMVLVAGSPPPIPVEDSPYAPDHPTLEGTQEALLAHLVLDHGYSGRKSAPYGELADLHDAVHAQAKQE